MSSACRNDNCSKCKRLWNVTINCKRRGVTSWCLTCDAIDRLRGPAHMVHAKKVTREGTVVELEHLQSERCELALKWEEC